MRSLRGWSIPYSIVKGDFLPLGPPDRLPLSSRVVSSATTGQVADLRWRGQNQSTPRASHAELRSSPSVASLTRHAHVHIAHTRSDCSKMGCGASTSNKVSPDGSALQARRPKGVSETAAKVVNLEVLLTVAAASSESHAVQQYVITTKLMRRACTVQCY